MKDLKINCPDGYVIDQDKSNLSEGIIYFKEVEKVLCYKDIAKKMFSRESSYYISSNEGILNSWLSTNQEESNNSTTREQLESILALNKLCNVAKYLNDGWLPDWKNHNEEKHCIILDQQNNIITDSWHSMLFTGVFFKSKELALQAIEILGEEEIRKALTLNH